MKIRVRVYGDVAEKVGKRHELDIEENTTVLSLTNKIQERSGGNRAGYLGDFKVGGADLAIMINGKNIALLDGLETKLSSNDDVVIMPFIAGG